MTKQERVSALWEILRDEYGIETEGQFLRAYDELPPIDITAFVEAKDRFP